MASPARLIANALLRFLRYGIASASTETLTKKEGQTWKNENKQNALSKNQLGVAAQLEQMQNRLEMLQTRLDMWDAWARVNYTSRRALALTVTTQVSR